MSLGTSSDPTLTTGTPFVSATGGADILNEFTVSVSTGVISDDQLYIRLTRLGSSGSDTLTDVVEVLDVVFEANVIP